MEAETGRRDYGDYLNGLVPDGFAHREDYERVKIGIDSHGREVWIDRARRRPSTGVAVLDARGPARVVDLIEQFGPGIIDHMRHIEQQMGLEHDF